MAGYFSPTRSGLSPGVRYSGNAYNANGQLIGSAGQAYNPITQNSLSMMGKQRGFLGGASGGGGGGGERTGSEVSRGGGGGRLIQGPERPRWQDSVSSVIRNKSSATLDLAAKQKAAQDAARQGVTAAMDAQARNITDRTANRNARGVYGPDGSAITGVQKVKVQQGDDTLRQLEEANYYKNQQANIDKQAEAELQAAAIESGTPLSVLRNRMSQYTNPKPVTPARNKRR